MTRPSYRKLVRRHIPYTLRWQQMRVEGFALIRLKGRQALIEARVFTFLPVKFNFFVDTKKLTYFTRALK